MGMMSDGNVAPQGDPTTSHGNYNGVVDVGGQQVQVQNGIAKVEGQPYFVSDNGAMVVDQSRNIIGKITDGKFEPISLEYLNQMRQRGYVE